MLFFAWWYCGDKKQGFFYIVLGQAPLILWELFSIVYYGFPFPNTYYAKLNTGLADSQVIAQGAVYFLDSFRFDPITLVVIATSILVAFSERNRSRLQPLAIGIFFYLVYILRIGGDFMSGRFFALPLLGSVIIISQLQYKKIDTTKKMIYLFVVIFLGLVSPLPTYSVSDVSVRDLDLRNSRISNERLWYDDTTGLLNQNRITEIPFYPGRRTGEEFRRIASSSGHLVAFEDAIGMEGYYGGPGVHLIDLNALSDPLLARLPMVYNYMWRPGHYIRDELIPGYLETVTNGENQIKDSDLKTYYNYLSQIIHGDIWSLDRFRTIVNMNLGKFDFLINRFNYQFPEVVKKSYAQVNDVLSLPINCGTGQGISFKENGLLITLPEMVQNSQKFDIAIDDNKQFQIFFYKNQTILSTMILFPGLSEGVNHINYFQINESVSRAGFDSLLVLPLQGDPPYCLGFLELK
jgi:arabinofuranosyltransferase